jgi:RHS repeat-associated protein
VKIASPQGEIVDLVCRRISSSSRSRSLLAALGSDPKVRYIERVGGDPSPAGDALIGVPSDPAPGPASKPRLTPIALGTTSWGSGEYKYDGAGNIISIGTDNYLYDSVQRLKQSSTRGVAETYTYDGFGNMTAKTNNGSSQPIPSVQTATNRYTGGDYTYNAIGAMKTGASYTFEYDAFGQPLSKKYNNDSSTQEYYLYTPGDERIGVQRGSWWTWSVRDESGKVLRQYRSSTTNPSAPSLWLEDFVWRDGLLLGSQRPPEMGGRRHYHLDHLGTPRLVTADNGQRISAHDYFPFGDEATAVWQEVAAGYDREDPLKFTGHERDYAGGMGGEDGHAIDDMHARYESPALGRFLSIDPLGGNPYRPQTWNRYAYVLDSPLSYNDPTGMEAGPIICNDDGCSITVTPDPEPVPQLPPNALIPQPFFWELPDGVRIDKAATDMMNLKERANRGDEFAMMQLGMTPPGLDEDIDLYMVLAGGIGGLIRGGATETAGVVPKITGFSKHAIDQAISREGRGVASKAILDALRNPLKVLPARGGATKVIGRTAAVVINEAGRVITVWARNSAGWAIFP